jgi:hypothetical protein
LRKYRRDPIQPTGPGRLRRRTNQRFVTIHRDAVAARRGNKRQSAHGFSPPLDRLPHSGDNAASPRQSPVLRHWRRPAYDSPHRSDKDPGFVRPGGVVLREFKTIDFLTFMDFDNLPGAMRTRLLIRSLR